jgi:hypothetical protein
MPSPNGWKSGTDPTLRALRAVAVASLIGLLIWWVIFDPDEEVFVGALLLGGLLAALFGDISIALPFLRAEREADDTPHCAEHCPRACTGHGPDHCDGVHEGGHEDA